MRSEFSAGGVVVAKIDGLWYVLLIRDKKESWTFPKGLIEKNESAQNGAEREVGEEVGLTNLRFIVPLTPATYLYKWEGALVKKTVSYFLFQGDPEAALIPQLEEGITQAQWMSFEKAAEIIGYKKTNSDLLKEAQEKLGSRVIISASEPESI